jgi:hypothetical protein
MVTTMILIPLLMGLVRWFTNRQNRSDDGRREDYRRPDYVVVQSPPPAGRRRARRGRY